MKQPPHKNKHWIEEAIRKPGSFSADAKHHGKTTLEFARKEKDAPGKLGRRARLAAILMGLRGKEQ